jgi:hypothetical protein
MLVFETKKHIESILKNSLLGELRTLDGMESLGYVLTLVNGKKLGYAVLHRKNGRVICAVETVSFDDRVLGEYQKKRLETYCHNNGIPQDIFRWYISLLERAALGERVTIDLPGTKKIAADIMREIGRIARLVREDETKAYKAIAELHSALSFLAKNENIAYDERAFQRAFSPSLHKLARQQNYLNCLLNCMDVAQVISIQAMENEIRNKIQSETIWMQLEHQKTH